MRCSRSEAGWTVGGAKPPLRVSSTVFGVQALFWPQGRQQASTEFTLAEVLQAQSPRFGCFEHPMFVTTFQILLGCCGRTGRLCRTGRNPLRSDRFLHQCSASCHLNVCLICSNSVAGGLFHGVTARIHGLKTVVLRLLHL